MAGAFSMTSAAAAAPGARSISARIQSSRGRMLTSCISVALAKRLGAPPCLRATCLPAPTVTSTNSPYDLWVHRWKPCAHAEFPKLARLGATLRRLRDLIGNTLDTGTTNARAEATHCPDDDHNDR